MAFPEVPPLHDLKAYEHARVYLHSNTLVSSYGSIKVRETDEWVKHVTFDGPKNRVLRIVVRGFDGMLIDGRGYASQSDANKAVNDVRQAVPEKVPLPQIIHDDGRQIFLDLRPYRDWLRQFPDVFEPYAAGARLRVAVLPSGMPSDRPQGVENQHRWVYNRAAFQIVNPSDRTAGLRLHRNVFDGPPRRLPGVDGRRGGSDLGEPSRRPRTAGRSLHDRRPD